MKKVIQNTDYAELSYDSELNLGKIKWKRKTTTDEYKYVFMSLLGFAKENQIDNFLSDIRDQQSVSPENRRWLELVLLPKAIDIGLKRAGVIFDGNVFKRYYINAIIKVTNKYNIPMKIFKDEKEAVDWFQRFN